RQRPGILAGSIPSPQRLRSSRDSPPRLMQCRPLRRRAGQPLGLIHRRTTGRGSLRMSSERPAPRALGRPAINPWFVAVAVVIPTFMEVLDTTIANVALRYIAGGLSASNVDSEWVLTSYLAANATILPITGWLSAHLGRRNYFLLSIAI